MFRESAVPILRESWSNTIVDVLLFCETYISSQFRSLF
jgi:hypothetical protein